MGMDKFPTSKVGGLVANPTATFTCPSGTPTYTLGDLVANSATAGSVVAMELTVANEALGSFMLRRCKLHKSGTSVTNASFRVHLFRAAPTCANGDDGAFSTDGVANYLGAFDVTIDRAFTDGAAGFGLPMVGNDISAKLTTGEKIYALVEARAGYTRAASEVFTLSFDVLPN